LPVIDKVRKQEADMRDCARRLAEAARQLAGAGAALAVAAETLC
jgi:hypothetical protein